MGWSGNGLTGTREGREDIANGPVELRLVCGGCSSQEIHPWLCGVVYSGVSHERAKHFLVCPHTFITLCKSYKSKYFALPPLSVVVGEIKMKQMRVVQIQALYVRRCFGRRGFFRI